MIKKLVVLLLCTYMAAAGLLQAQPYKQMNSAEILLGLKKLNTLGSVLYIAAHPDDENTRLLAYMANELGVRTGYLAMTRGDGGQNLIGTEQGELLGLIRTQELLDARRIDGAEQFFTRANDFGFSKGPEETFKIWNKDSILSDVVWVIRKFRPDVIITRFPDDGSGGHGHHTASALLAEEAFNAAADPKRFPEQLKYVEPWQAKRLFWNHWGRWRDENADLSGLLAIDVGQYNPLLGEGYGEMAAQSRSMHKSQGFGSAAKRGEMIEYFKFLKGEPATKTLFDNINTTWSRVPGGEKIGKLVQKAISTYDPQHPDKSISLLVQVHKLLAGKDDYYSNLKRAQVENLIVNAAGLYTEALATDFSVTPGQRAHVVISTLNRSSATVSLKSLEFNVPYSKGEPDNKQASSMPLTAYDLKAQKENDDTVLVWVPVTYPYTTQYWLREPHTLGRYTVKDQQEIGKAEDTDPITATFSYIIDGEPVTVTRPVMYKWTDPVAGERYRQLEVVPPVTVNIADKVYMLPGNAPKTISMTIKSGMDNAQGTLRLGVPNGWTVEPAAAEFKLARKGDEQVFSFTVTPAANATETVTVSAVADINGQHISRSVIHIEHPHIPIQVLFPPAEVKMVPLDVKITAKRIGYISGAGDEIPASLRNIGCQVDVLNDDKIDNADLSVYDAIVTGVRAYNVNDRMHFHYDKLMNYVKNGGRLVVQYNTNNQLSQLNSKIGPYPFKVSRDRVTVEEAPVTFAEPNSPVLNTPNKITDKDFDGWIQERGIYFAQDWDANYHAPLEMNDPGEKPNRGSLIYTQYGKGYFVYTGLVFFRELPAGVPGAYRLFANLLSL